MVNHIMTSNKKQILFISKRGKMHKSAVFSAVATGFAVCLRQKGVEFFFWVCYNVGNQSQGSYIGNTTASQAVKAGSIPVPCSKKDSTPSGCCLFLEWEGIEPMAMELSGGERTERCQWQIKRGERVAAVDKIEDQRKPEDFIGHRNRGACGAISKRGNGVSICFLKCILPKVRIPLR